MSILNIKELSIPDTVDVSECSFEDSGVVSAVAEIEQPLSKVYELRERVLSRGTVCRQDALDMFSLRDSHESIKHHLDRITPGMYTESLSKVNLAETVASLESAVAKSIMSTISDVSKLISARASSAMSYISDIFDDEQLANKNALRVMIMVEYAKTIADVIGNSKGNVGLSRAVDAVIDKALNDMAGNWSGLKDMINDRKSDTQGLVDAATSPVIDYYPDVLKEVITLLEGLEKAKTSTDIRKLMESIHIPNISHSKLLGWIKKKQPGLSLKVVEGSTPFQTAATQVRDLIKGLSTDRQTRFKSKAGSFLKDSEYIPLMTSQVGTDKALKRSKEITEKYTSELTRLGRVAQKLVLAENYEAEAMPLILEILSAVRGFSALEETLGLLALGRRELIGDYMSALTVISKDLHELVKENSDKFMISEVKTINDATIKLKASLEEV